MDSRSIIELRLRNLRLIGAPFATPVDAIRDLGAVQSQDHGPAKWSVAMRTRGVSDAAMDRAFAAGHFLRTHVLRPTWHFVTRQDIAWLLELTAPRVHALNGHRYRELELDKTVRDRSARLIVEAVRGNNHLTRKELQERLASARIDTSSQRLAYMLMNAELEGLICSGVPKGKQHTYGLLDERAPGAKHLPREEALRELTLRYFSSHGPATVNDFRWWSSLRVADIRSALAQLSSDLQEEVVDGISYWWAPRALRRKPKSPTVHLLQAYDEYIVGYTQSKPLLHPPGPPLPRRATFNSVVTLDGRVAGHWKRTFRKGSVALEVRLLRAFDGAQMDALRGEAQRHARFLGSTAELRTTSP